jgi:hypothetical protein
MGKKGQESVVGKNLQDLYPNGAKNTNLLETGKNPFETP